MKRILTSKALCLTASASMAQIGAIAPDFTAMDINGIYAHNLYTYLNAGKVVLLDVSTLQLPSKLRLAFTVFPVRTFQPRFTIW